MELKKRVSKEELYEYCVAHGFSDSIENVGEETLLDLANSIEDTIKEMEADYVLEEKT